MDGLPNTTAPLFLGSEIYRGSIYAPWHPLRVPRVSTVMDLTRALGWLPREQFRTSPRAKPSALEIWHDPDYLQALVQAEADQSVSDQTRDRYGFGTHSQPIYPEMYRRPATSAGGSLWAGALLADGGVVYHPAGGTHHGMPDRANGFCYLNDPVLAILSLQNHGAQRVAYIDIDAHHPDGVEHAFAGNDQVLMMSVHEERRWPFTGLLDHGGGGNCWNLPVPRGLNDTEFSLILEALILPLVEGFRPDAIVLQCGADAVTEDPLSRLELSNNAHWHAVRALGPLSSRYLVLGGGGYNPWSVGRLWTGVWAQLAGHTIPDILPEAAQSVLRDLRWEGDRRGKNPPEHWFTTLRDAPRLGVVRPELSERLEVLLQRPFLRP